MTALEIPERRCVELDPDRWCFVTATDELLLDHPTLNDRGALPRPRMTATVTGGLAGTVRIAGDATPATARGGRKLSTCSACGSNKHIARNKSCPNKRSA